MNRKSFLKSIGSLGLFFGLSKLEGRTNVTEQDLEIIKENLSKGKAKGNMVGFADKPLKKTRVAFLGLGNRGEVLLKMMEWMVVNDKAEIVALCDLREEKTKKNDAYLKTIQSKPANLYYGSHDTWKEMVKEEDYDIVVISTPWEDHAEMSIYHMENGKHVACEVPIAYSLEDCWKIIEVAERTQKHCIMLENCCYNDEELWVLNMVEQGVFGELNYAEGAYIHDLRWLMLDEKYYEDQWRLKHHQNRDGNFYTTHGLGPISFYMDIGRGDNYDYLVSVSSKEYALSDVAKKKGINASFKCGDINNTIIKTKNGRTILLQFDVHTGRPYDRINLLAGSKAVHKGYPSRLYIDPDELSAWGHKWLNEADYKMYRDKYRHPLWDKMKNEIAANKLGHGGMDFVMMYRLIECLNVGLPLDINLYDGILWSAITPLSELSVAEGSQRIDIPDFTGGTWNVKRTNEVLRVL